MLTLAGPNNHMTGSFTIQNGRVHIKEKHKVIKNAGKENEAPLFTLRKEPLIDRQIDRRKLERNEKLNKVRQIPSEILPPQQQFGELINGLCTKSVNDVQGVNRILQVNRYVEQHGMQGWIKEGLEKVVKALKVEMGKNPTFFMYFNSSHWRHDLEKTPSQRAECEAAANSLLSWLKLCSQPSANVARASFANGNAVVVKNNGVGGKRVSACGPEEFFDEAAAHLPVRMESQLRIEDEKIPAVIMDSPHAYRDPNGEYLKKMQSALKKAQVANMDTSDDEDRVQEVGAGAEEEVGAGAGAGAVVAAQPIAPVEVPHRPKLVIILRDGTKSW